MTGNTVPKAVAALIEPIVRERGLELVDVQFHPQGRRSVLRLVLDRPGGVSLDDLSAVSREVSDLLDVHDVVPGSYYLECSSPGINRPLRTAEDFARFVGRVVRVRTATPLGGVRVLSGRLAAISGSSIEIDDPAHGRVVVGLGEIDRANYEHDFAEELRSRRS